MATKTKTKPKALLTHQVKVTTYQTITVTLPEDATREQIRDAGHCAAHYEGECFDVEITGSRPANEDETESVTS